MSTETTKPEPEPRIYRIRRYYFKGRPRTIHANVTLTVAQLHCNDPRTRKAGVWFDGYDYMPGCAPKEPGPLPPSSLDCAKCGHRSHGSDKCGRIMLLPSETPHGLPCACTSR